MSSSPNANRRPPPKHNHPSFQAVDLGLEKAVVAEQLKNRERQINKLQQILNRKKEQKIACGMYNENMVEHVESHTGVPLGQLRIHHMSVKAIPKENPMRDVYKQGPPKLSPIGHKKMVEFLEAKRLEQRKVEKAHEDLVAAMKEKKRKKEPIYPKINIPPSMLPGRYIRGELPCTIEHGISGHYLSWACPLENLDYEYYLPIFFDGLQLSPDEQPSSFLARQGIEDMLIAAKGKDPIRVISCLKSIIRPLRNALSKYDPAVSLGALKALQQLALCHPKIGESLLPFCRQFIGPISVFLDNNRNIGDAIDYGQRKLDDIGEEVRKTLELFEETGGANAFKYIKFSVPVYESCMIPPDNHHNRPP